MLCIDDALKAYAMGFTIKAVNGLYAGRPLFGPPGK